MNKRTRVNTSAILAVAVLMTAAAARPASADRPPAGKTYYIVSLGVATDVTEAYEVAAGCVRFTRKEICDMDGDCGTWWWIPDAKQLKKQWQVGFEFELIDDETGLPIKISGVGRIDARGPKSSIGGAAHGVESISGTMINFALAGRAVGEARCEQLVADFASARQ